MNDKPRDSKESLFSHGGYALTFGYGAVITIATLFAFLMVPILGLGWSGITFNINEIAARLEGGMARQAQTAAFCVLSFSELIHMLGMTSIRKSFIHNFKTRNKLLWIAFGLGVGLQLFVVLTPGINSFFKCAGLRWWMWIMVGVLSLLPLVVHEIIALILFLKRKSKKE